MQYHALLVRSNQKHFQSIAGSICQQNHRGICLDGSEMIKTKDVIGSRVAIEWKGLCISAGVNPKNLNVQWIYNNNYGVFLICLKLFCPLPKFAL